MKAVRLHAAGDLRVEQVPEPGAPAAGWVRLRVEAAGICGSDLHNYRTGQWISRSPSVAGHEFAGVIVETGGDVDALGVGDRVVADSRFWCGNCRNCRSARPNLCETLGFVGEVCDGGFAEETVLPARLVLKYDGAVEPEIAAMAEPLAVALHAIRRLRVPSGEPVLVAGCGPIGGLAALLLSRMHDDAILVADRNAARSELVAEVTGAAVVDLEAGQVTEMLRGRVLRFGLDATGNVDAIRSQIDLLAGGGALALVGISHGRLDLDPNLLVEREISLVGCHAFADELPEAVRLLSDLTPGLERFVERRIGLDEVPAAYDRLLAGQGSGLKTIIRMGGS